MLLLIISALNALFLKNNMLRLAIAFIIFIIVEIKRKNGSASRAMFLAEFISVCILILNLVVLIIALIHHYG